MRPDLGGVSPQELADRQVAGRPQRTLKYFFAGGGSYTQPRAIAALDQSARITVAEIDPVVTELAETQMYVSMDRIEAIHSDARVVLSRQLQRTYDVIITDAFHDIAVPYHLITDEYIKLAKSRLATDGLFATNVVDAFPNPRLVKSLVKTLQQTFAQVDVWLDEIPSQQQRMTYVIAASDRSFEGDFYQARSGFQRNWYRINEPLFNSGDSLAELPVLSDDYAPVERLIAGLLVTAQGL